MTFLYSVIYGLWAKLSFFGLKQTQEASFEVFVLILMQKSKMATKNRFSSVTHSWKQVLYLYFPMIFKDQPQPTLLWAMHMPAYHHAKNYLYAKIKSKQTLDKTQSFKWNYITSIYVT